MNLDVERAYDIWADQYDTNENKTRDLEVIAIRQTLAEVNFKNCLEIGCGTGKNTEWLLTRSRTITAVDLSDEMLTRAKSKLFSDKVEFLKFDIKNEWSFGKSEYDLITFSLVLEHIENLDSIFCETSKHIANQGYVYIGELHPFKQYNGTKARFENENGIQVVTCFNHHISDFLKAATNNGFILKALNEYFDDEERKGFPRILSILFQKA